MLRKNGKSWRGRGDKVKERGEEERVEKEKEEEENGVGREKRRWRSR